MVAKPPSQHTTVFSVENPPAEAAPDFTYEPCKGLKGAVIGESQKEEEAGLALCTFPAPCSCVG
jgi:hypothetical protein